MSSNLKNVKSPWNVDWFLYKERNLVECFFHKLKQFRPRLVLYNTCELICENITIYISRTTLLHENYIDKNGFFTYNNDIKLWSDNNVN